MTPASYPRRAGLAGVALFAIIASVLMAACDLEPAGPGVAPTLRPSDTSTPTDVRPASDARPDEQRVPGSSEDGSRLPGPEGEEPSSDRSQDGGAPVQRPSPTLDNPAAGRTPVSARPTPTPSRSTGEVSARPTPSPTSTPTPLVLQFVLTPTPTPELFATGPLSDLVQDPATGLFVTPTPPPTPLPTPTATPTASPTQTPTATPPPKYFEHFGATATGHSWANSYLLALISDYIYDCTEFNPMCDGANDNWQNRFKETFLAWGMTKVDFVDVTTVLSDTQAVVMSNNDVVIVAFRGTEANLNDYLADAGIIMLPVPVWASAPPLPPHPFVHSGFYNAQAQAYGQVKAHVDSHMNSNKTLWLTGHSLGAALATLVAYNLEKVDGVPVRGVYTYGSPQTGDGAWSGLYNDMRFGASLFNPAGDFPHMDLGDKTHRWVNNSDLVAALPSGGLGYLHVGNNLRHIDHNGNVVANPLWPGWPGPPVVPSPFSLGVPSGDHYGYPARIYDAMPQSVRSLMPPPN
ncbi:MAG: hypothetical protein WD848_00575 [Dehalococcoidia bacterium]